jgi:hypothetical protein
LYDEFFSVLPLVYSSLRHEPEASNGGSRSTVTELLDVVPSATFKASRDLRNFACIDNQAYSWRALAIHGFLMGAACIINPAPISHRFECRVSCGSLGFGTISARSASHAITLLSICACELLDHCASDQRFFAALDSQPTDCKARRFVTALSKRLERASVSKFGGKVFHGAVLLPAAFQFVVELQRRQYVQACRTCIVHLVSST